MNKLNLLTTLFNEYKECTKCDVLSKSRTNIVFGRGNKNASILIVDGAPSIEDEAQGRTLIGECGEFLCHYLCQISDDKDLETLDTQLSEILSKHGRCEKTDSLQKEIWDKLEDAYFFTNAVMCRPPKIEESIKGRHSKDREPAKKEILECNPRLREIIYTVDPDLIIAVGKVAAESIFGGKVSVFKVAGLLQDITIRGKTMDVVYPVLTILHPSWILRQGISASPDSDMVKTYAQLLFYTCLLDEYNFTHKDIPIPQTRPKKDLEKLKK